MSEKNINSEYEGLKGSLLEDHEYDGIRELDNPPPPWWNWMFYLTIIWSVWYMLNYHVFKTGDLQDAEFKKEMAAVKAATPAVAFDENKIALLDDEVALGEGKALFVSKTCVTCHGANGEGNMVGPNLCDEYSINGNSPEAIFKVIKHGVNGKMTPFGSQMSNKDIVKLTSYILKNLYGTTPANAKAPQGQKIGETAVTTTESSSTLVAPD